MAHVISLDELPAGLFAIMFYEVHITDKKHRTVKTARDFDGAIYTFYANTFLEEYIKNMSEKKSFAFYNDRMLKAQIKIVSEKIIL